MPALIRLCAPLCLLLLLGSSEVNAFIAVEIEADTQGNIPGDATFAGEVGWIEATGFSSTLYQDYDPATGRLSGRLRYAPVVITKNFDRASVPLTQALHTTERLRRVSIRLYFLDPDGALRNNYTIEMTNAHLVSLDQISQDQQISPPTETWGFVFETITWIDLVNSTETTDNWTDVAAAILPPGPSTELTLLPPLPNPSTMETLIRFDLPIASRATLDVYDVRGRRVTRLFDEHTSRDRTIVRWNGRDSGGERVAHGLYLLRLSWPEGEVTQRVTLMR